MTYNPDMHHRRSIRLKEYDYSQAAVYFITICTHNHQCIFGEINNSEMQLNELGEIVRFEWLQTQKIRSRVDLDLFVIMPNHFHGIIILNNIDNETSQNNKGTSQCASTYEQFGKPTSDSIPTIIRLFKSVVTKRINQFQKTSGMTIWQRNYY